MKIKKFILEQIEKGKMQYVKKNLKKNYREEYKELMRLTAFIKNPKSFSERIYCVLNDIKQRVICKSCRKHVSFINFKGGYGLYCSKKCALSSKETIEKRKNSMLQKYGFSGSFGAEGWQDKRKAIMLKKYGVEHAAQMKGFFKKREKTNFERYGNVAPMKSKRIQRKKKKTMLEKYGVEHSAQLKATVDKMRKTNLERYGVEIATQSPKVQSKTRKTKIKNGTCGTFIYPNIGANEKLILDKQEMLDNCTIDRNFRILNFCPDGYCHETNTIYEVYEKKHKQKKYKREDRNRKAKIQRKLKCKFVVLWDL
jgi:hypothetical protein